MGRFQVVSNALADHLDTLQIANVPLANVLRHFDRRA